jgi:hypothetical protein
MAKRFSVSGFAVATHATPCSGFVGIVIADSAIAAPLAAPKLGPNNGAVPTAATSRIRKYSRTIADSNGSIGAGTREHA